jgi:saccharopine dehydrogenase-like NADP-dependent oxidoreductase
MDFYDPVEDLTAMARTTWFPSSVVALIIAKGEMDMPGDIHPTRIGYDMELFKLLFRKDDFPRHQNY